MSQRCIIHISNGYKYLAFAFRHILRSIVLINRERRVESRAVGNLCVQIIKILCAGIRVKHSHLVCLIVHFQSLVIDAVVICNIKIIFSVCLIEYISCRSAITIHDGILVCTGHGIAVPIREQ